MRFSRASSKLLDLLNFLAASLRSTISGISRLSPALNTLGSEIPIEDPLTSKGEGRFKNYIGGERSRL